MAKHQVSLCILTLSLGACSEPPADEPKNTAEDRVIQVATEFVDGYYSKYPEEVYEIGYPDSPMDRFGDNSEEALADWDERIDNWLAILDGVNLDAITDTNAALTYVFAR